MASIGSFKQQPAETLDYDIDFSEWLPVGDTIVSATVAVEPATGLSMSYAISSPRVKVWCFDAVAGSYKITVTATTNDARVKQVEFKLRVKDE